MSNPIQKFIIKKLFGIKNISIDFDDPIKLLISENGGGKTTVLYMLYLILSRRFHQLNQFDFEEISLTFSNGSVVCLKKNELSIYSQSASEYLPPIIREIKDNLGEDFHSLIDLCKKNLEIDELRQHDLLIKAASKLKVPKKILAENMNKYIKDILEPQLCIDRRIRESFNYKVIYLPTYRRIERAFDVFESADQYAIQFGMNDISNTIDKITSKIKHQSVNWFMDIDEELLDDVYGLISKTQINDHSKKSQPLSLDPFSEDLSEKRKQQILEILKRKESSKDINPDLAYLFTNLLQIREQQIKHQTDIESLAEVCNKYLVDKKFEYDDTKVELKIVHSKTNKEINLADISSGEKQIVSLFVKLFLGEHYKNAIIIDEPELSISIEWQKMLLPDIWNSNKCCFLLAATHSPFIFENEFDEFAITLSAYVEDIICE
jgi:predicted ATPase